MNCDRDIYFTDRFRMIHSCLVMFMDTYYSGGFKGVDKAAFIGKECFPPIPVRDILSSLTEHNIIFEKNRKLYPDREKFSRMSLWDLLVIAEPWLKTDPPPDWRQRHEKFAELCRSEKLCGLT